MTTSPAKIHPIDLAMGDCVLTPNTLLIRNEDGFRQAGAALAAIDTCSSWWWGDYFVFAKKCNLATVLASKRPDLHRSRIHAFGMVAEFYAAEDRHPDLSFTHHEAAMYCLGPDPEVEEARKWLRRAAESAWTVGELREAMRTAARAGEADPGPMRGIIRLTDFIKISRWAETVKAEDLDKEEAEEIRKTTEPLYSFLCDLHRKPLILNATSC